MLYVQMYLIKELELVRSNWKISQLLLNYRVPFVDALTGILILGIRRRIHSLAFWKGIDYAF